MFTDARLLGRKPLLRCGLISPRIILSIPNKHNKGGARRRTKRSSARRNERSLSGGPGNLGDIPKAKRLDQMTASVPRPRLTQTYTVRSMNFVNPIQLSTSNQAGSYYSTLSGLQNSSSYIAVFDQYKYEYIRIELKPTANALGLYTSSTTSLSPLYLVIDYDNATNLTGISAAQQYDNCMILEAHESASRAICPRMAVAAYSGSFASYANAQSGWVDCSSNTVQFYGFKWYLAAVIASQTLLPQWDVYVEEIVSFRNAI